MFESTSPPPDPVPQRRRALDNPRVIVAAVVVVGAIGALIWLSNRTTDLPPLLTGPLVYTLYSVDLAILAALSFVLARNLFKVWVEQRGAAPFERFRGKLVTALLVMTIIPAVLVLITGSEIINSSFSKWFSAPAEKSLEAAKILATEYYREHQDAVTREAKRLAAAVPLQAIVSGTAAPLQPRLDADV